MQAKNEIIAQYGEFLANSHPLFELEEERNPWFYAASVILSANTTDAAVNKIMPEFKRVFPTPQSIIEPSVTKESIIKLLPGINHNGSKSDYLQNLARHVIEHNGEVAKTIPELTKVKGIGRKSAAVIVWHLYSNDDGFPLDTHCLRILERLGWYPNCKTPNSLEKALLKDFPEGRRQISHIILTHLGRTVCTPKNPACETCKLRSHCSFACKTTAKGNANT